MKKQWSILVVGLALAGCSAGILNEGQSCRFDVTVTRENAYKIDKEDFQIELTGYQKYCYYSQESNSYKMAIRPIFRLEKLSNTAEQGVDFVYYIKTQNGMPKYIGEWFHSVHLELSEGKTSQSFIGKQVVITAPRPEEEAFEVFLGLKLNKQDKQYRSGFFDI